MPIRVLNLFTIMNRGGAETMVMNYYRQIDRSKIQFDFLVHRQQRGAYDDEIEAFGGRIYRAMRVCPQNFNRYKKYLREFFAEHHEYRIIHSHMSELGYFIFKEAKLYNIPCVICHAHNKPIGFNLKLVFRTYFKVMMRAYITDMFVCAEPSGEWLFGKHNKEKFVQLNNAINANKFRYCLEKREIVRSKNNLKESFVIGHVGRFDEQKNHVFLLDVFYELKRNSDDAVLVLVGTGGAMQKSIEKKAEKLNIRDSVRFLGVRDDIYDIMQAMDAFVFPSLYEGLPVALIEAQASGLPILASDSITYDVKLIPELRFFSLNHSASDWADKLLTMKDIPRRNTYNEIVKSGYDISGNVKWLEDFYLSKSNPCST